jgi:adenosylcobinamide kinase/adenosylcobinamide-phosphate guanylyltransferase
LKELILGGARSGKSGLAERRAAVSGLRVTYVATARALDAEMAERLRRHRQRRPDDWGLMEEPLALAASLTRIAAPGRCLLVDCLTLWLSNLLAEGDERAAREQQALLEALPVLPGHIILVSNEVGQGIVPDNALARRFRDQAGVLHQALGEVCERVTFTVAGLPWELKNESI